MVAQLVKDVKLGLGSLRPGPCAACPMNTGGAGGCLWPDPSATIGSSVQQIELPSDRSVLAESSRSESVWIVRSGFLRVQRFGYDGRRQILCLILPGEVVGYGLQLRDGLSVETATDCKLCRIDKRMFDHLMETDPDTRRAMYLQQMDQLDRLRWLTWAIGALKPRERLCAFLALSTRVMPYQPMPDGSGILSMQISRSDIADLLGTSVESISRITHRLHDAGVLVIRDPEHFQIVDLDGIVGLGRIERAFHSLPFGKRFPGSVAQPASNPRADRQVKPLLPMTVVNETARSVAVSSR